MTTMNTEKIKVLLVDDEYNNIKPLKLILEKECFCCHSATSYEGAIPILTNNLFSFGIYDLKIPSTEIGLKLIKETKTKFPNIGIVILTASGDDDEIVQKAYHEGADSILDKTDCIEDLFNPIRSHFLKVAQRKDNIYQQNLVFSKLLNDEIIGNCSNIKKLRKQIIHYANHTLAVYILGESGTGKELAAKAIHNHSPRRGFDFVDLHCSAIHGAQVNSTPCA